MSSRRYFGVPIRFAFKYFGSLGEVLSSRLRLEEKIQSAALNISPQGYGSILAFYIALTALCSVAALSLSLWFKNFIPLLSLIPIASLPITLLTYPSIKASERKRKLAMEFPFIVAYVGLMSIAGIHPYKAFERLAEQNVFEAAKREGELIVREKVVFTKEPVAALESIAKKHPLREFRNYILGYINILRTGGNTVKYLTEYSSKVIESMLSSIKRYTESAKLYGDLMIALFVFAPLGIFSVISVLVVGQGLLFMKIYTYVLAPMTAAAFIFAVNSEQPKFIQGSSQYVKLAFKLLLFFSALTVVLQYMCPELHFKLHFRTHELIAGVLLCSLLIPSLLYEKHIKECSSVESHLPAFLRNVAEARRIGLSIEKSLMDVIRQDYGHLSRMMDQVLRTAKYSLTPLDKALESSICSIKSWIGRAVLWIFKEAIVAGGGNSETFELLANFTESYIEVKKKVSKELRAYYVIGYAASIMFLLIILQLINLGILTQMQIIEKTPINTILNVSLPSKGDLRSLIDMCLNTTVMTSAIIGIIVGKISSGSIAGGFKHAIVCTIISIIGIRGVFG